MKKSIDVSRQYLRRRVGFRGGALLTFAFIDYIMAYGLADKNVPPRTDAYRAMHELAPYQFWALLWLVVALICTAQAFNKRSDVMGFVSAMSIKAVWAAGCLTSWLRYDVYRGWVAASTWCVLGLFVLLISYWKEPVGKRG